MSAAPTTKPDTREIGNGSELPEGWAAAWLRQVCELNPSKPAADALPRNASVTFVPMLAVDAQLGAITAPEVRHFGDVRKGYTAFAENDVIMAKITPCMENGKAAIAQGLTNGIGFGSTEFHVFRSNGALLPAYIYHFIRQESFRRAAESEMTGSVGQKRVPVEFLKTSQIPVPPVAEQKRLIEKLEELLMRCRTARERLEKGPALVRFFRQSVLAAACSGKLTEDWRQQNQVGLGEDLVRAARNAHSEHGPGTRGNAAEPTEDVHTLSKEEFPDTWTLEELKWLCEPGRPITYGILKPGPPQEDGVLYVRVADFPNDHLRVDGIRKTTRAIAENYRRSALREHDVLLSIRGTVGRVCQVPAELEGANITQDTARLSIWKGMSATFVALCLRSPSTRKRLEQAIKGVAVRGVNIGDVRALQIPVPPLAEQHEIVRCVESLFKLAEVIEKRVAAASGRVEHLSQAVLAKAFRGELVPTEAELARREGRKYEPASVLLTRIKADGDSVAKKKVRRNAPRT